MFLLIVVEIRNLTHVLFIPPPLASDFGRVDSSNRSGKILGFSKISLIFMLLLFLVISGLIRRLGILAGSGHKGLRSLGVIPAIQRLLCLDLMSSGIGRSIPSETILVRLSYVKTRL